MTKKFISAVLAAAIALSLFVIPATAADSATTLQLSVSTLSLGVGETFTVTVRTNSSGTISWRSRDTAVATVNGNGRISALKEGTTTIRATADGVSKDVELTVRKAPTAVRAASDVAVPQGQTTQIRLQFNKGSVSRNNTYTSSDKNIATVNNRGVVTGVKEGTTTVTVETFNGKTTTLAVTVTAAEIIKFGGYDWRVLDVQDGKALIISDKLLERRPYRYYDENITWADSEIRAYLNGEFYNSFSTADRARIVQITNQNPDNPWHGTPGGVDTRDRIFLLSLDELVRYFGDSGRLQTIPAKKSNIDDQFTENRIAYDMDGKTPFWWLRSPGIDSRHAAGVDFRGFISVNGANVVWPIYGVRPAMWITL